MLDKYLNQGNQITEDIEGLDYNTLLEQNFDYVVKQL